MAVNVKYSARRLDNRYELLAWLNETLQTSFTKLEQVSTGAVYCQMMDRLFPGSVNLSKVRFQMVDKADIIHNYGLLLAAFKKMGVTRHIPVESLMKKSSVVSLTFLQWFKLFFDANSKDGERHASDATAGQSGRPANSASGSSCSLPQKLKSKATEEPREEKPREPPKGNADVISLISDNEDDVVEVTVERKAEKSREMETVKENGVQAEEKKDRRDTLLRFIKRYCANGDTNSDSLSDAGSGGSGASVSSTLSPDHPADIILACSNTPYCLYLYVGVELDGGESTSVVLIGYLDPSSGANVLRVLDALQTSADTADPQSAEKMECDALPVSDADVLMETLRRSGLPLSNLAAFYCDSPRPAVSRQCVSQLQGFSPLLSLCGFPGAAARACEAGLLASFSHVIELIRDLHHHCSSSSCDANVKGLFAASDDPSLPIPTQCLHTCRTLKNMGSRWRVLVEYFKSRRQSDNTDRIRAKLTDPKVKLHVLFLCYVLEPLLKFEEVQQSGRADLATELQVASRAAEVYAFGLLQNFAAKDFLRWRNLSVLQNDAVLLPASKVDIGFGAKEVLVLELGEQQRSDFLKDVVVFYRAVLRSLATSLPDQLGVNLLLNISILLKWPDDAQFIKDSRSLLPEFGTQLGLSVDRPASLAAEYLQWIRKVQMNFEEGRAHSWAKLLDILSSDSSLRRLFLILLALPKSLLRERVFALLFSSSREILSERMKSLEAVTKEKECRKSKEECDDEEKEEEAQTAVSAEDSDEAPPSPAVPHTLHSDKEESDETEDSSDVVDVTEEEIKISQYIRQSKPAACSLEQEEYIIILEGDEDDDHVALKVVPTTSPPLPDMGKGELVWGQVEGFSRWPGIIRSFAGPSKLPESWTVEWYGQGMCSQMSAEALQPFADFAQCFCANSYATLFSYNDAIFLSLQEAALRCEKKFSEGSSDREVRLKQMLDWAFRGFQPTGPEGFKPAPLKKRITATNQRPKVKKQLFLKPTATRHSLSPSTPVSTNGNVVFEQKGRKGSLDERCSRGGRKRSRGGSMGAREGNGDDSGRGGEKLRGGRGRGGWRGGRGQRKRSRSNEDPSPDDVLQRKREFTKVFNKVNETSRVYAQPNQELREEIIGWIVDNRLDIEEYCLCCGSDDVEIFHPLFKGGLCLKCKDNLTETLYRYDEDGYQSYCTICCYGLEVILCGNDSCCRSYCADCLNVLVGPGTFDSLKELDPWICYLCQPHKPHRALFPREDWSIRVQGFFANNSAMEFEPHRVYPSVPANRRRPIRVLSLFDGIATGYLVLKDLGFKVGKYIASEVCEDSVAVATVNHDRKIVHVDDVRFITMEHLEQWGPFDLLIGGSPCNDLSIVNPVRKGLYEGTGRLFFEYYRILQLLKPKEEDPRPFFWLFENVVFMNTHDKVNICRFLECNPVLMDAVKVSPAHRARYFWGNIPGMSRPITASQSDKLSLQDCLEVGREAQVTKVRTITTNPNSLKQSKSFSLPVLQNGKEDNLWITELEKIFGFPKHYTDVRNMSRMQRQKVLGKAWSVPVIRHLFAPLKDYFACEELPL